MNGNTFWPWLGLGLVPYHIDWQWMQNRERTVKVQAIFWSLAIQHRDNRSYKWKIDIPLIERMRRILWKVAMLLKDEHTET